MRITRSLILLLTVVSTAAGCGRPPAPPAVRLVPAASAQVAAASGIDNVVYGPAAPVSRQIVVQPAAVQAVAVGPARPAAVTVVQPAAPAAVVTPLAYAAPTPPEGPYTLDSGDRLRIVVFGQDGLTNSYNVDASGHIAMPLIGSVSARGLTTDELSQRLAEKLRQGFIREPHVAVEIEAYRPFFILGEVTAPGQYPYVANMTVETAVAIAGGFAPRAFRKQVTISRNYGGRPGRFEVPVTFPVRPGDTINVQERWF